MCVSSTAKSDKSLGLEKRIKRHKHTKTTDKGEIHERGGEREEERTLNTCELMTEYLRKSYFSSNIHYNRLLFIMIILSIVKEMLKQHTSVDLG